MLGMAALRAAGSGLESGYSRGRACAIWCVGVFPCLSGVLGAWHTKHTIFQSVRTFSEKVEHAEQPSGDADGHGRKRVPFCMCESGTGKACSVFCFKNGTKVEQEQNAKSPCSSGSSTDWAISCSTFIFESGTP